MSWLDWAVSYGTGLATTVTVALGKYALNYWINRKPLLTFWKENLQGDTPVIVSSFENHSDPSLIAGLYDSIALSEITALFSTRFKKARLSNYLSKYPPVERLNENIILIGGPCGNNLSKNFLQKTRCSFVFTPDLTVYDKQYNRIYFPEFNDKSELTVDYGIIIKAKNPNNCEKKFYLFAGCYDYGTYLAVKAIANPKNVKRILEQVQDNDFELLVKGKIEAQRPQTPEIVSIRTISS